MAAEGDGAEGVGGCLGITLSICKSLGLSLNNVILKMLNRYKNDGIIIKLTIINNEIEEKRVIIY